MTQPDNRKKTIALFFLCLLLADTLLPIRALALTSGPAQPESKQFMAAGTSDMVDLFSGDFKYNIPLLDIDGYPVNLNYQSGANIDDEASWTGCNWNLNAGAVNRQLRGIPDDISGAEVEQENYTKPQVTYGGRGTIRSELKGWGVLGLGGSLSLGIFSNNYTGIGAEFGANAGLSLSLTNSGTLTGRLGIGVNSSTSDGVDVSPTISLAIHDKMNDQSSTSFSLSATLGYNTRQGLKDLTLAQSFSFTGTKKGVEPKDDKSGSLNYDIIGSTISYNTPPFFPRAGVPYKSTSRTFSINAGYSAYTFFLGGGLTGYKTKMEIQQPVHQKPAYGFLYAGRGKDVPGALMDFMREKDNPMVPGIPNIPLPIATPDLFSWSGHAGSGQFRLYSSGSGVFFDPETKNTSDNSTLGGDLGFGSYFHGGISYYKQNINTTTGKWKQQNYFLAKGDFRHKGAAASAEEDVYFKQVGEKNVADPNFIQRIQEEKVVSIAVSHKTAGDGLNDLYQSYAAASPYKKDGRQVRRTPIAYLTAREAVNTGIEKEIRDFPFNTPTGFQPQPCNAVKPAVIDRCGGFRRPEHISEITVQGDDGRRMVYGLPVYNVKQEEYTFAVNPAGADVTKNRVPFQVNSGKINHAYGVDEYYSREKQPAYATSYLLTALLSNDYADLTGNGISDDDRGTAIKFNYSKTDSLYKWRSPYESGQAFYNKALNADPTDDKGSFVYGEKELWYLHSIESKNKIAYFITEDREDALGVTGFTGGKDMTVRQKRLKEIRLYAKNDLRTPIKTVVLEYDYSLCAGVPNVVTAGSGKLTLKKVYFTYASSTKGTHHPYTFSYNNTRPYEYLVTDRWGTYKPSTDNANAGWPDLRNDEFPYTTSTKAAADANAGMWQLNNISLPTGGSIIVDYEADDYAYVQHRQAMQMTKINGLITADGNITTNLADAKGFRISIPATPPAGTTDAADWFKKTFLNDQSYLYAKLFAHITDQPAATSWDNFDFIPCYGKVNKVNITGSGNNGTADVYFEDANVGGLQVNPFVVGVWQKMRLEYPRYAYPGYNNRIQGDRPVEAALGALVNAIGNLAELKENFYKKAKRKGWGSKVILSKSFARIVQYNGHKLGGGSRVKMIRLKDNWQAMAGSDDPITYGQYYEYLTTYNGKEISSGVAAYEPPIGADENPMRLPIPYLEQIKGGLNNYFYLEEPFAESLFPAPEVGYSRVVVKRLDGNNAPDPNNRTGWDVFEFYTARDFPAIVQTQPRPYQWYYQPSSWFSFFGGNVVHEQTLSQGYTIILNDMHGKPKAERAYNQSGSEISSTVYYYDATPLDATSFKLRNTVKVVDENGQVDAAEQVVGREIEMFVDMREQEMKNFGESLNLGVDVIPIIFAIPFPIPHWPKKNNNEYRLFRSASVLKTVHYYGMPVKVVKTVDGASLSSENLLFDRYTGEPVLTSTQNEFNDPVYTLNIPAYWIYPQMGGAYKSLNNLLQDFSSGANGVINAPFAGLLTPGDELVNINDGERLWVIQPAGSPVKLVDETGRLKSNYIGTVKVCRSGYRNQLTAGTFSITCLKNPLDADNRIGLLRNELPASYKILDAKTTLFAEAWGMPGSCDILPCTDTSTNTSRVSMMMVPGCYVEDRCPPGYTADVVTGKCVVLPQENNSNLLNICTGDQYEYYGGDGTWLYDAAGNIKDSRTDNFWWTCRPGSGGVNYCGRLNESGIRLCGDTSLINQKWVGFKHCFDAPATKTYYIGLAADDKMKIYIDNVLFKELTISHSSNFGKWHVYPIPLDAGHHTIRAMSWNEVRHASVGVEIYNSTYEQLLQGNTASLSASRIFNTRDLVNKKVPTFITQPNGSITARYSCSSDGLRNPCGTDPYCRAIASANVINPYLYGYLGNWKPAEHKAYETNRSNRHLTEGIANGVHARNSGYYQAFSPYWSRSTGNTAWQASTTDNNWVTTRYVTLYDNYGQEIENKDALNRYSSALFSFKQSLPAAVATNAMKREIFYEGFDDYYFNNRCAQTGCDPDSFSIRRYLGSTWPQKIDSSISHTGPYSLKLQAPVQLKTIMDIREHRPGMYLGNNTAGEYFRMGWAGLHPTGFSPSYSKKYIFSAWVKDADPKSTSPGISLVVNGAAVTLKRKAVVEGWKLVEGIIDMSAVTVSGLQLQVTLSPSGGAVNLDDVRIFPYDAQLKSYTYDDRTMRLMAELDENNLATLYEYDDEGSLVRVKKETDRGIMTIKENRAVYRRQQ